MAALESSSQPAVICNSKGPEMKEEREREIHEKMQGTLQEPRALKKKKWRKKI